MNTHKVIDFRTRQREQLLSDIAAAKNSIDMAHENFNRVSDPYEVDIYVYRLRAAEAQYGSLLKKLKEL